MSNPNAVAAVRRLQAARLLVIRSLSSTARDLPKLTGVTQRGDYTRPLENVHTELVEILIDDGRVYRQGNSIVFEESPGENGTLKTIAVGGTLEANAPGLLANVFICETNDSPPIQFPPKKNLLQHAFSRQPTLAALPEINVYSKRPLFDEEFNFRGEGWHPDVGYLVHSFEVELGEQSATAPETPLVNQLLDSFLFKCDDDRTNALSLLITGMLIGAFVERGKPIAILDGNQPGVGKTWFALTIGTLLDGERPDIIRHDPRDEELEKRICASLIASHGSAIVIDNAKVQGNRQVSSAVIEAQSAAPEIRLRILGKSALHQRRNDLLWMLTMNQTQVSADIVSRGIPIQFFCEGDPGRHDFPEESPLDFAKFHRQQIISELVAMVEYWSSLGRPSGGCRHRFQYWAGVTGGVLSANGHGNLLANAEGLALEMNRELDKLVALTEEVLRSCNEALVCRQDQPIESLGCRASELVPLFTNHLILSEVIEGCGSDRSKATTIGSFLSSMKDRTVSCSNESEGLSDQVTLRVRQGRGNAKLYYFQLATQVPEPSTPATNNSLEATPAVTPAPQAQDARSERGNTLDWGQDQPPNER